MHRSIISLVGNMWDLKEMRELRRRLGITQTRLAEESGVSQSLIARIEAGKVDPRFSKVRKIYETLKRLDVADLKAEDLMSRGLKFVVSTDSVEKAAAIMRKNDISQLPVFQDGTVVGSITEKDVLNRVANGSHLEELSLTPVKEVMRSAFPEVTKDTPLMLLSSLLEFDQAVLVKDRGKPVGIITRSDLLKLIHR